MVSLHSGGGRRDPKKTESADVPPSRPDPDRPPPGAAAIDIWAVSEDEGEVRAVIKFADVVPDARDKTLRVAVGIARVAAKKHAGTVAFRGGDVRVCDHRGEVLFREKIPAAA